jgi:hypothetical protein
METIVIPLILGWVGGVVGYFFNFGQERQRQRIANTFALAQEFDSESMFKSRCDADNQFVPRDGTKPRSLKEIYESQYLESMSVLRVIHFFKRLDLLKNYNEIDEKLARHIFSKNYHWWFDRYIVHQIEYLKGDQTWDIKKYEWLL